MRGSCREAAAAELLGPLVWLGGAPSLKLMPLCKRRGIVCGNAGNKEKVRNQERQRGAPWGLRRRGR